MGVVFGHRSATLNTLREFYWVMEQNIDDILSHVYAHLSSNRETAHFYQDEQSVKRAKAHQREHMMRYVFRGNFGAEYYNATNRIGKTHHKLGIDFKIYSGAYCIVLSQLAGVVYKVLAPEIGNVQRYMTALNRVILWTWDWPPPSITTPLALSWKNWLMSSTLRSLKRANFAITKP